MCVQAAGEVFATTSAKLKLSGSKRSTPTTIFGGPSLALSLL